MVLSFILIVILFKLDEVEVVVVEVLVIVFVLVFVMWILDIGILKLWEVICEGELKGKVDLYLFNKVILF